ncbi:MAG: 4-hydroxy-3-methylbut-2-enyl diphosphate reductase [Rikenellaceae bacterium]|jgi:4-hydroxy-3-methylbut-2-enyl diphosphate reductase|nr:4-hydroxy-3-methylbut-2-enyl diphosphate reductase [Rikenellaceae bacterium]
MKVEIDSHSGFCGGVIRAIDKAEKFLAEKSPLYSLGEMVHNEAELKRLASMGLIPTNHEGLEKLTSQDTLLIRAHGEAPSTYEKLESLGINIIDCTCPVVLKIQESIRESHKRLGAKGTIVIFGKIGHAEVLGLMGQVGDDAVVVESLEQLKEKLAQGKVVGPVEIFSQTTMSPAGYEQICRYLSEHISNVTVHDTICRQVAYRHRELVDFAKKHDAVVFVSGRQSSNGQVLCELCRSVNPRTYRVVDESELQASWFSASDIVGVCGATSTPKWLLEKVAEKLKELQ